MSPRPVSLLVWRDAKTDPPRGDTSRQVLVAHHDPSHDRFWVPTMHAVAVVRDRGRTIRFWAERPVVGELTDDDVKDAIEALEWDCRLDEHDGLVGLHEQNDSADRLRAALGGKEKA